MITIENWFLSTHRRCSELPKKTRADILCTALMEAVGEEEPESLAVRDLMDCVRMIKEHVNVLVKRVNRYRSPLSWDKDSDVKLRHDEETLESQMADLDNTVAKLCHTSGSQRKRIVSLINENRVGLRGAAGSTSVNFLGGFSSEEAYFVFNRQSVGIEEAAIGEEEGKISPATAATAVVGTKKNSNFTNSFVGIVVEAGGRGNKGKSASLTKQSNAAVVSLSLKRPQGLTVRAYFWTGESVDVLDIGSASTAEGQLSTLRDVMRYDHKDVSGKAARKLIVTDSGRNAVYCVPISNSSSSPSGFDGHDPKQYLSVVGGGRNMSRGGGFRSPCGLAVYGDMIVVCDQGNHTLRSIEYVPKEGWAVGILAGRSGVSGVTDGDALSTALLQSPSFAVSTPGGLHFVEQGKEASLRRYDGTSVTTIHRGAPLRNPTGVAYCTAHSVLVSDNTAARVWVIDTTSGSVEVAVDVMDMPPCPPYALSVSGKEQFSPHDHVPPVEDRQVNWAKDRATVADLRREVCRWMTRVLQRRKQNSNSSTSNVVPMGERVEESSRVALDEVALALSLWEEAFSSDDRYSLEQVKVATWVAEVHVESLLLGTVSVTGLEKNTLLSDRTLNAVANLYPLSSLPMDDRLFDAFGAALVSANFNELAQCILAGQVTVDLFKKVVSQQADLVQIWQVTSVLIDISLLRALEQEMSQHNATLTTVIK
eukprot:gene1844-2168_t